MSLRKKNGLGDIEYYSTFSEDFYIMIFIGFGFSNALSSSLFIFRCLF
jgi:hypothetical protein